MIRKRTPSFKPRLEALEDRCCPSGGGSTIPPGTIYYSDWTPVRNEFGWYETFNSVYSMKGDGSSKTAIANFASSGEPSRLLHPDLWILDTGLVAGSYPNGAQRRELFAVRQSDGLQVQLTDNPSVEPIEGKRWALDDTFASFTAVTWTPVASGGNFTDSGGQQWLVDAGLFRSTVTWSSGLPAAAASVEVLDGGLMFMSAGGYNGFREVTPDIISFDWSPAGTQVAYDQGEQASPGQNPSHHLRVTTFDVTGTPTNTAQVGDGRDPGWAPDGSRIAYDGPDASFSGYMVIRTVKPDGTGVVQVTKQTSSSSDTHPDWSPDSKYVAFTRRTQSNTGGFSDSGLTHWLKDVLRVPAAGGTPTNLTKNLDNNAYVVAWRSNAQALLAASTPIHTVAQTLSSKDANLLLAEAVTRWQTAGVDTSAVHSIDIRIADLGGTTLGLAAGHTIWLDNNAAGWGWFVDATPWDDSEFTTPGNQGEQNRMDLLTVLEHEVGHLLGKEHAVGGVMAETLSPGTRLTPFADSSTDWLAAVDVLFAEESLRKRR